VDTAYAAPRVVKLTDRFGNPISGVQVTFSGPATGAGVTFPDGDTAITDADGEACIDIVANEKVGTFTVTATTHGFVAPFRLIATPT
jgi:Bacterial Ig-like domain (group 1)